jgi:hypothetical protein
MTYRRGTRTIHRPVWRTAVRGLLAVPLVVAGVVTLLQTTGSAAVHTGGSAPVQSAARTTATTAPTIPALTPATTTPTTSTTTTSTSTSTSVVTVPVHQPPPTTTVPRAPVHHPAPTTTVGPVTTTTVTPAPTTTVGPKKRKGLTGSSSSTTTTPGVPAMSAPTTSSPSSTPSAQPDARPPATTAPTVPPPTLSSIASDCSVDVSAPLTAYLASLPDGAVFSSPSGACYQVDEGITITHPLVITGGTFKDLTDSGTGKHLNYHPIIEVREGDNVTLENLTVEGEHTNKGFAGGKVGEAGIKVFSSTDVTITNVLAEDTFGDGLELVADFGRKWSLGGPVKTPDSDITVNGFTSYLSGRTGITPAEVVDSTFTDIYLYANATRSIDFESDVPLQGAGNDSFNNVVASHGINMIEHLSGPITFDHTIMTGRFALQESTGEPVAFSNGSFTCERMAPGACVTVKVGELDLSNTPLYYLSGSSKISEPGYATGPGAQILGEEF